MAYLAGTRQLAERVKDEAAERGLEVVRFAARDYGAAASSMTITRPRLWA
ncbi:hypothetical protein I6A60_11430 [Frankia sp. AgB1.9]|nr:MULTISPECIES: hypothetical protein [unclassified Frankia]MBL7490368.1 hypothetical protein [Frankia sp. AgW1.1]MBL7548478.1 hypothetical protein [Frankia sp. AgB1.9]MBL7618504.1 hypothetical protein [Frankia sp. AgB1.8]